MEARIKELGVILKKAAQITPKPLPEKKKKTGIPARVDTKIKIKFLPEVNTEGKKFALIAVRSEAYGHMDLLVLLEMKLLVQLS